MDTETTEQAQDVQETVETEDVIPHKFVVKARVSLDFLGDDWKECYVVVIPLSPAELLEEVKSSKGDDSSTIEDIVDNLERGIKRVRRAFVEGKGFSDGQVVELTVDDVTHFPTLLFYRKLNEVIMGQVDPNLEQLKRLIVQDGEPQFYPLAAYRYSRFRYQERFGLDTDQLDNEIRYHLEEFNINCLIMSLLDDRHELERKRQEQARG